MTESVRRVSRLWMLCKATAKFGMLSLMLIAASIVSYAGVVRYFGNIHVVDDGRLYRSARLGRDQLEHVIRRFGIKSILNVRGEAAGEVWYENEIAVSKALHLAHFDYGLSAEDRVTAGQIEEIIKILREAPKPILVHCEGGADRSGLVSALFLAEIDKKPAGEAASQLSILYGHFPYLMSKTRAMDESFWAYVNSHRP
jgi:protein tyrosine/serine phosphatase